MRIAVFGLGYVGAVTVAGLASRGHVVTGVDVDEIKVEQINGGRSPVIEPGIDLLIETAVAAGTLRATTDPVEAMAEADVSLLCVGTPSSSHGGTDLTYLTRALADIRHAMTVAPPPASGYHAVVVRSTVPPGTVDALFGPLFVQQQPPPGWSVGSAMCPEFLREGSGVSDFFDPPFVVIGTADPRVNDLMVELFAFLDRELEVVDVRSAEGLKYACNAFHATKVSFANEMGRILRSYGVDARKVMQVFCEDRQLNISSAYLMPAFAFGGSCLPKDLRALLHMARVNDLDVPLLAGTARTNELVIADVVDRVIAGPSRTVALLGLSFKMGTDDLRESPNVELSERLIGKGFEIRIYDPFVNPDEIRGSNRAYMESRLPHLHRLLFSTPAEALEGCDTALVATSHPAVIERLCAAPPARILDLHGRLGATVEQLPGYEGIGWAV